MFLACGAVSSQTTFGPATLAAFEIGSGSGTTTTQNFAPHNGSGTVQVSASPGNSPWSLGISGFVGDGASIASQALCLAFLDDFFECLGVVLEIAGVPFLADIFGSFQQGSVLMTATITSPAFPAMASITLNVTFESGTVDGASADAEETGSSVVNEDILRVDVQNKVNVLTGVVHQRVTPADEQVEVSEAFGVKPIAGGALLTGSSAGEGFDYPWGLWASYQHTDFGDDFTTTAFDANTDSVLGGADFSPWDNFVFGLALGYDQTDADTTFNAGESNYDSWTIGPYLGALLSDQLGVNFDLGMDMSLLYSSVDVDQFRTDPATLARVTSSTSSDRWSFAANVGAGQNFGNLRLDARTGFLFARDDQDGFTESNGTVIPDDRTELGRFTIGAETSYDWNGFVPFVSAFWEKDFDQEEQVTGTQPQPSNDDDDVLFGAGLRWFGESISASFEYNSVLWREDFNSDTYTFLLRAEF